MTCAFVVELRVQLVTSRTAKMAMDEIRLSNDASLIEGRIPSGSGVPPHTHTHEDEAFYVLAGEIMLDSADRPAPLRLGAGSFFFGPRATTRIINYGAGDPCLPLPCCRRFVSSRRRTPPTQPTNATPAGRWSALAAARSLHDTFWGVVKGRRWVLREGG